MPAINTLTSPSEEITSLSLSANVQETVNETKQKCDTLINGAL